MSHESGEAYMALQTDLARARSQGRAAALTVMLDDEQASSLASMGFTDEWIEGPGEGADLPDNPYAGGRLAQAWTEGFNDGMDNRHLS